MKEKIMTPTKIVTHMPLNMDTPPVIKQQLHVELFISWTDTDDTVNVYSPPFCTEVQTETHA